MSLVAIARSIGEGRLELLGPAPGVLCEAPRALAQVIAGQPFALLEVLGRRTPLIAPAGARGIIRVATPIGTPIGYGDVIAVLGLGEIADVSLAPPSEAQRAESGILGLRASSSGRFYRRAAPGQPAFVSDGDVVSTGQTVGLLEVMKTFSRIHFTGDGLPATARVVRVVPADGADVEAGDILLELAPAAG